MKLDIPAGPGPGRRCSQLTLQEASRLGRAGMQGVPEPAEPGKGVSKAPAAVLGARRSGTKLDGSHDPFQWGSMVPAKENVRT